MELTLLSIVSWMALSSSIFLYLSGGSTCLFIIRKKTVGNIPLFPFIATCVSSTIWLKYGFIQNNGTIKIVNSVGSSLQLVYICIYYSYCRDKRKANCIILPSAAFLYAMLFYAKYLAASDNVAAMHLGLVGTFLSIVMTASPLVTVSEIIRTKCTASMAFPFVFVCFVSCILWALFGILIHDAFIVAPNAVGVLLGIFQLSFFLVYPSRKPETITDGIARPLAEA
ncbi:sugar transporter SWEET1-like [Rhopilema esculentum]|uniref:sugar transporter SWEET1-like n=1 Tax=Rhopilema esculentum TaxID=499914 RepID=UPI0031D560B2